MPGKISNDLQRSATNLQASRSRGGVVACSGRGIDDLQAPATWRLGSDMAPRLAPSVDMTMLRKFLPVQGAGM